MDEDAIRYCGTICYAASQLGIGLRIDSTKGGFSAVWADPVGMVLIGGPTRENKASALKAGCETLVSRWAMV